MEAHYHLFNALEMNDEAAKTKKSIEFAKNTKKKEGKRLTNSFNAESDYKHPQLVSTNSLQKLHQQQLVGHYEL